jgi:peptide-methionine (S)-S-oxide reductase
MFSFLSRHKTQMPTSSDALPGRSASMPVPARHVVLGTPMEAPFPEPHAFAMFGLGCFWGAEKAFWKVPGVISTAVGYAAGYTENPTYQEVCSGRTGHNEVVRVVFDPSRTSFSRLLEVFFESHDPTQGMRQGNDVGTQYRSGIYAYDEAQRAEAEGVRRAYGERLAAAGYGEVTTEVIAAPTFYFAEEYHQQYLAKNPGGYCGLGGTGVACPVGIATE